MGLSVGWGDKYSWTLLGQYVCMTGLPAGDYRLLGTANPDGVFFEQREDNNDVFVDLRFRRDKGVASIKILRRGARPVEATETTAVASEPEDHAGHDDPPSSARSPGAATVRGAGLAPSRRARLTTRHASRRRFP